MVPLAINRPCIMSLEAGWKKSRVPAASLKVFPSGTTKLSLMRYGTSFWKTESFSRMEVESRITRCPNAFSMTVWVFPFSRRKDSLSSISWGVSNWVSGAVSSTKTRRLSLPYNSQLLTLSSRRYVPSILTLKGESWPFCSAIRVIRKFSTVGLYIWKVYVLVGTPAITVSRESVSILEVSFALGVVANPSSLRQEARRDVALMSEII